MPRVAVRIPGHVLSQLIERAEEQNARDALWRRALSAYLERKASVVPPKYPSYGDRQRRDTYAATRMPRTIVEVPDGLFKRADKLAKRLHKSRELLYAEAMAEFLQDDGPPDPGFWSHRSGGVGSR